MGESGIVFGERPTRARDPGMTIGDLIAHLRGFPATMRVVVLEAVDGEIYRLHEPEGVVLPVRRVEDLERRAPGQYRVVHPGDAFLVEKVLAIR